MLSLGLALVVLGLFGLVLRGIRRVWPSAMSRPLIFLFEVAAVATWVFGGDALASLHERRAQDAWTTLDPTAAVAARGTAAPANSASVELVRLASGLGIRVGRPDAKAVAERDPVNEAGLAKAGTYLDGVFRQADDRLAPAPAELRAWLVLQDAAARAVEKHLRGGGQIEWGPRDKDDSLPYAAPELLRLHAVLTAGALERMRAGDAVGASAALEAASALAASLRDRPDTVSRLVAVALDRRLLGALRQLDPAPPGWEQKLDDIEEHTRPLGALPTEAHDLLEHVRKPDTTLRGLILETDVGPLVNETRRPWLSRIILSLCGGGVPLEGLSEAVASEKQLSGTRFFHYVQGPLERPYMRLVAADYATVQAQTAGFVAGGDSCGPAPLAPLSRLARWSPLAEMEQPFVPRLARTQATLRAELELTRLVVRARALRAQSPRREWPNELQGADSRACAGRRFVARTATGSAEIRLEPQPFSDREATVAFRMAAR